MSIVVGVPAGGRGRGALHLAAILARSAGDELVLCAVVPRPWPPSPAKVDAEYRAHLESSAAETLEEARAQLPAGVPATTTVQHARSVPAGLLDLARERDASMIVVGSSSAGAVGRVSLGGVDNQLMHSSHIPVALPPRGYRCKPVARVIRLTAAYGGAEGGDDLVVAAARVAARLSSSLRIASFAVRSRPPYTSGVGREGDQAMVEQWVQEIEAAGRAALDRVGDLPQIPAGLDSVIGHGETWGEALEDVDWLDDELLAVGSSSMGPVARVFLGARASKIVRASPVPVLVIPRAAAEGASLA